MSALQEERVLLADVADKLLRHLAEFDPAEETNAVTELWPQVEDSGLASILVPESAGGVGGSWEDAFVVLHAFGRHSVPLPIAETILGRHLLGQARIPIPEGPLALICGRRAAAAREPWKFVANVVSATQSEASWRITLLHDHHSVVGSRVIEANPLGLGALAHTAMMAGALNSVLEQSVQHANERHQFGRPIGKFQVIQHALAALANEVAVVTCAALAACRAADRGTAEFQIAAAKLRANRAVGIATSIAHQVHGAMGFTAEHRLRRATQRLWSWRSEYGNDRYWASRLGGMIARHGNQALWASITALDGA